MNQKPEPTENPPLLTKEQARMLARLFLDLTSNTAEDREKNRKKRNAALKKDVRAPHAD